VYPTQHAAATAVATAILCWRGWGAGKLAAFAAGGVLLDVDHYLSYVACTGDLSLRRAYLWNRDRGESVRKTLSPHVPSLGFESRRPFHWPPLIVAPAVLASIAGRWSPGAAPLLVAFTAGAVFHRALDAAWESAWSSDPPPPPPPRRPRPLRPAVARAVRRAETAALIARHVARCIGQRRMPW
jgi:hypothetical protein